MTAGKYKDVEGVSFRNPPPEGQTTLRLKIKTHSGMTSELAGVIDEKVALEIYQMLSSGKHHPDKTRMDKLEKKTVNVRTPLRYGSKDLFWATPEDVDGGPSGPSDIRAKIDKEI